MDQIYQNRNNFLGMSFNSLQLPPVNIASSPHPQSRQTPPVSELTDDHLIPGRRSFMLNPYGIPSSAPLKLPKLRISPPASVKRVTSSRNKNRVILPSLKLTKHEQLQEETASSNTTYSKMDRLNMDFDRKLSSVHQSIQNFHKKVSSVKDSMNEAVRRSVSDAARNKAINALRPRSDRIKSRDSYEEKCAGVRRKFGRADVVKEQVAPDETATSYPVNDNLTQNQWRKHTEPRSSIRMSTAKKTQSGESCAEFGDHFTSCTIQGSSNSNRQKQDMISAMMQPQFQLEKVYDGDKCPPSLGPIMENLSDKAFLTKLKIKDGQANRTMQKMQNRANVIQNQLQLDKLKAKLETMSPKPLYKARKEHLPKPTESRHELMGFLQSNGGSTGKWNSADHNRFLKIYHAWKGVPELIIETCIEEFKHKTVPEILAHAEWFEEYEDLIESNKSEVRKWDEGRRKEREMIYQMEAEERKNKLEDEKRRKDHLIGIRIQERQRARLSASKWKNLKNKSDAINAEPVEIDTDEITQEMLSLAKRVQSLANPLPFTNRKSMPPNLRHVSAKTSSNFHTSLPELGTELKVLGGKKGSKSATQVKESVERIKCKLPSLEVNEDNDKIEDDPDNIRIENQNESDYSGCEGDYDQSQFSNQSKSSLPKDSVSNITSETFSHRLRKEAQLIKRMEIRSLRSRVPHRVEEIKLESFSNSLNSLHPKKGTPTWRKIS